MDATESGLTHCGIPVLIDGSCQHRSHHPRQITPELLAIAAAALRVCTCPAGRNQHGPWRLVSPTCPACGDSEAKARAVLKAVL